MKEVWKKFQRGDSITDKELDGLIQQAEAAKPYLEGRLPEFYLAWRETVSALDRLHSYRDSRRRQKKDPQAL